MGLGGGWTHAAMAVGGESGVVHDPRQTIIASAFRNIYRSISHSIPVYSTFSFFSFISEFINWQKKFLTNI